MLSSDTSSCDLFHTDGCVSARFASVYAVEMIDSLPENLKMKICDFHSHVTDTHVSDNAFCVDVCDAPEKLQCELTEP
jgi:Ran GTPase-activating protein (RanGAP) involved in mRNA processing and transport